MAERATPARRRRPVRLVVLIASVMGLLLAEATVVVLVFVSPSARSAIAAAVEDVTEAWAGTDDRPGIQDRVAEAVRRGYERWVVPLWAEPRPPRGDAEFAGCVRCHPDYASKRRFSSVFMDHPLHAQIGVACATCHEATLHPNPPLPDERTCATCHREVEVRDRCGTCHPPASLPHFALLGAGREGVVRCESCHPRSSFGAATAEPRVHVGAFDGSDRERCLQCHEPTTCQGCHASRHPPDWRSAHGLAVGGGGQVSCYTCHTNDWCADRCHSTTPGAPPTGGGP
ncbi:MAG TPA: hypothetical protein VNP94_05480 [Actinomycetota bacterium]|nr:hypothetical protein [Actinomycetota bacterium]